MIYNMKTDKEEIEEVGTHPMDIHIREGNGSIGVL